MADKIVRSLGPPNAANVAREADGKRAEAAREYVAEHFHHQRHKIINMVMANIASADGLDPQYAVEKWLQLYAIQALEKSLDHDEKLGGLAARKNSKHHLPIG